MWMIKTGLIICFKLWYIGHIIFRIYSGVRISLFFFHFMLLVYFESLWKVSLRIFYTFFFNSCLTICYSYRSKSCFLLSYSYSGSTPISSAYIYSSFSFRASFWRSLFTRIHSSCVTWFWISSIITFAGQNLSTFLFGTEEFRISLISPHLFPSVLSTKIRASPFLFALAVLPARCT